MEKTNWKDAGKFLKKASEKVGSSVKDLNQKYQGSELKKKVEAGAATTKETLNEVVEVVEEVVKNASQEYNDSQLKQKINAKANATKKFFKQALTGEEE